MAADGQSIPTKCLNCHGPLTSPAVCGECRLLYPPPTLTDYFALLGLTRAYALDETELRTTFRALARNVHPDHFAGEAEDVVALATRLSAEANQAFHVLSDPVRRAGYLLELAGGPSSAEMREVPSELLTEVMTLREQIDEAKTTGDDAALERQREIIAARRRDALRRIEDLAESIAGLDKPRQRVLRRLLNSIKYLDNLLTELAADPLASEVDHLFVYGTLRRGSANETRRLLARNADFVGEGEFQGRLFDIGEYPGAIPSADPSDRVRGEVYALRDDSVLLLLDEYEGRWPGDRSPTEFRRDAAEIILDTQRRVKTHIYLYDRATGRLPRIGSGDWFGPDRPSRRAAT